MSFYKEGIEKTPIVGDMEKIEEQIKISKENGCKLLECKTIDDNIALRRENIKLKSELENLLKAHKEKEIETNNDKEIIVKLSFELGKYQEKSKEDEAVIEEMARFIDERINECPYDFWIEAEKELNCADCEEDYAECWKQYFRNKVKEK